MINPILTPDTTPLSKVMQEGERALCIQSYNEDQYISGQVYVIGVDPDGRLGPVDHPLGVWPQFDQAHWKILRYNEDLRWIKYQKPH